MARTAKNEKALTPEEKLAQALVSNTEQPYRVPENWCWTTVKSVAEVITGGTPSKKNPEYYGGLFPFFKPSDLDAGRNVFDASEYLSEEGKHISRIIPAKSSAVCCIGSIGKCGFLMREGTTNQQINSAIPKITPLYLYYYFLTESFVNELWSKASATTISIVNKTKMEQCFFPLAPLAEQQRIVDRIESLFAKLDEAKEKAQAVVDSFEDRKAAILNKAFTGELTEEWRRDNSISKESWKLLEFDDCVDVMQNGIAKRKGDTGEPYVVLRLANLSDDGFDETDLREIVLDEKEQTNYELHSDDVLMVRVNGSKDNVGKQYRITNQKRWAFCDHIIRIKYVNSIVPQYMVYFSKSETYRQYIKDNMVSSAGQNTISRKGMARLQIPMPLYDEQEQIVSVLSHLFEKEQQAKEAAEHVIDQIDAMKKSILALAFRGELGTNDPSDESAVELLKRVLYEGKANEPILKSVRKRTVIPKELDAQLSTGVERDIIKLFIKAENDYVSLNQIMSVSSRKFELLDSIKELEKKGIIIKIDNGTFLLNQ